MLLSHPAASKPFLYPSLKCNKSDSFSQGFSGIVSEKIGLLSRLFRRSTRRKGTPLMGTFSAQYPPTEWFNPRVVHLHNVATQTRTASPSVSYVYSKLNICMHLYMYLHAFVNAFSN